MDSITASEAINDDRRRLLGNVAMGIAAADALSLFPAATEGDVIRPFHINFAEADLVDLRRRVKATKRPERETVTDATQGVQLATMRELARYWQTDYDWRKVEATRKSGHFTSWEQPRGFSEEIRASFKSLRKMT